MKEVRKIVIPESLKDITIDQLVRYTKIDFGDTIVDRVSYFFKGKGAREEHIISQVFSIFCNISYDMLKVMSQADVQYVFDNIVKAVTIDASNLPLQTRFTLGGVEYGMIPNLNNMTFGEFVDLDTFITPAFEGDIKHEEAFRFMATLYRPIKGKVNNNYQIEEYTGDEDWMIMKQAPADVYLSAVAFFLNLRIELLRASLTYMEVVRKEADEQSLVKSGDGTEASLALRNLISQAKNQLQDSPSPSALLNSNLMPRAEQYLN